MPALEIAGTIRDSTAIFRKFTLDQAV